MALYLKRICYNLDSELNKFEFSVVNQKKKYYNINIGNEALPWVIIPKPQLC